MRNEIYEMLSDITKEGVPLKTTFSTIIWGIEIIKMNNESKCEESNTGFHEKTLRTINIFFLDDTINTIWFFHLVTLSM